MSYRVVIPKPVQKKLDDLPSKTREKVTKAIVGLRDNPRPKGVIKLVGTKNEYRIRVGDYRVVYEIQDDTLVIFLIRVGPRKDIYN